MQDPIKEKYNIFKGVVGLFDTKLSATVIVSLIVAVVLLFNKVGVLQDKLNEQKDEMYERLISEMKGEVHKQTDPIKKANARTNAKVDTILEKADSTLNKLINNIPKKRK